MCSAHHIYPVRYCCEVFCYFSISIWGRRNTCPKFREMKETHSHLLQSEKWKINLSLYKPKRCIGKCLYSPIQSQLRHLIEVVVSLTPWRFRGVKNSRYPSNRKADGNQNLSGGFGERIKHLLLTGFKPRTVDPVSVITVSTEPLRFIFFGPILRKLKCYLNLSLYLCINN
jgi:hypothetical protein